MIMGMGDIGEADEKVQRFYGILPKEKPIEIKTVRMVIRDNKERSSKTKRGNSEEDSESVELSVEEEEDLLVQDLIETHIDIRPLGLTSRMTKTTKSERKNKNHHLNVYS